ncbi:MAG: gluconokinase [Chitinophagaceae bacterium]
MNPIIYIMGVAGSGKTTIGKALSFKTGIPFFDGDDFHPPSNKEKMKAGHPLTDDDRQHWLQRLHTLAVEHSGLKGAVIACSALKEKYRVILSSGVQQNIWIFLQGDFELIFERMKKRDHFMPVQLLHSQFDTLEIPQSAFTIDIKNDPDKIVELIIAYMSEQQFISAI